MDASGAQPRQAEGLVPPFLPTLRGVASVAVVIVGAVYIYGLILKGTALHGADLRVSDTLPLVPLEQILLLGAKGALELGVLLLLLGLVALVVFEWRRSVPPDKRAEREGRRERARAVRESTPPKEPSKSDRVVALALAGVALLIFAGLDAGKHSVVSNSDRSTRSPDLAL
jgi:hypothetical protein